MRQLILSVSCIFSLFTIYSQTTLFFEDFESGGSTFNLNTTELGGEPNTSGDNRWVINNVYTGGSGTTEICVPGSSFSVANTDPQPAGISSQGGNYLHILSDEADTNNIKNANYSIVDGFSCFFAQQHTAIMNTDINTSNMVDVTLNFWWLHDGSADAYGELYYSIDQGFTWFQVTQPIQEYYNQSTWTQESITNPVWDNQNTLRFAFVFVNNQDASLAGQDPAFSLDDISVEGTTCTPTSNTFSVSACEEYTVPSGDETYYSSGTVNDTITNIEGCDSVLTINLSIYQSTLDTTVSFNSPLLVSNQDNATYEWYTGCDTMPTLIGSETSQSINIQTYGDPGYYMLVVSDSGCVDSSACIYVDFTNIDHWENSTFEIFPNPTSTGQFTIDFKDYNQELDIRITDLSGKTVFKRNNYPAYSKQTFTLNEKQGIYLIQLTDKNGNKKRLKLMLQ